MATFVEPDILSQDIANKVHDFDSDVFKLVFSSAAPAVGTTFLLSNVSQITTGGGYTQMTDGSSAFTGSTTTLSFGRSAQTTTVSGTQVVFTATGAVAAFRYVVWINDTPVTPLNPVIGWIDHGSSITMANTDTYTVPAGPLFTIN
jgi:hypothetical protein